MTLYYDPSIVDSLIWLEFFAFKAPQTKAVITDIVQTMTLEDKMHYKTIEIAKKHGVSTVTIVQTMTKLRKKRILPNFIPIHMRENYIKKNIDSIRKRDRKV